MLNNFGSPKLLLPVQTGNAAVAVYWTSPFVSGPGFHDMVLMIISARANTAVTLHVVPAGDTPVNGNKLLNAFAITAGNYNEWMWDPKTYLLLPGATIQIGFAPGGSGNIMVCGNEYA